MAIHLIFGKGTNLIEGTRAIHTYSGEVVTEDNLDYAAMREYEPDHTTTVLSATLENIPRLREACKQNALYPTYHVEADNGLTYCGLVAAEVWTAGILMHPQCEQCRAAVAAHLGLSDV